MSSNDELCIYCNGSKPNNDELQLVGAYRKDALETLVANATALEMHALLTNIKEKNLKKKNIYIHKSCRTILYNSCRKRSSSADDAGSRSIKRYCNRTMRSDSAQFDFSMQCFYCEKICKKDPRHPERQNFRLIQKNDKEFCNKTLSLCALKEDLKAKNVERRLLNISDLIAVKGRYHINCRVEFERKRDNPHAGRPKSQLLESDFEIVCTDLENMSRLTIHDFSEKMQKINGEKYSNVYIKNKLLEKYGTSISFLQRDGKSDVILLDIVPYTLGDKWYADRKIDMLEESKRIVITAGKLLKDAINKHKVRTTNYYDPGDIVNPRDDEVPPLLLDFMSTLIKDSVKLRSVTQVIHASCKSTDIMPLQFALAVVIDHKFGSKWLNKLLHDFGFCVSYDEVIRFKQNVVAFDDVAESTKIYQSAFVQFVGDNTDHDINTIDGYNTHHGLGSIIVSNGSFNPTIQSTGKVPRLPKTDWSSVPNNNGIPILTYNKRMDIVLKSIELEPLANIMPSEINGRDIIWVCNRLCKPDSPSWAGFMSITSRSEPKSSSIVTMLPIIDLNASDPNSLFSLLSFIVEQCHKYNIPETAVTFDQPLFIKAFEIVHAESMPIFVRLGGFHQLMSFLGSIGYIMEGSGLREALECVYAPVSVGHMLSGKAYARAVRGHLMISSALLSIILEPHLNTLSADELQKVLNLDVPDELTFDTELGALLQFLDDEKQRLKSCSRTAALWLQYIDYVSLVQDFVRAERTSDWPSHLVCTRKMLNLFAASGHMNYAKSCRLYYQSALKLEENFPYVYENFMKGEHTVRRKESVWSGLWTDLSIEQILMKSLKGSGGVIGRGMTSNVTKVWTKTLHRCAEITSSIDKITSSYSNTVHEDLLRGRILRDNKDFVKFLEFFYVDNPFVLNGCLQSLSSGLYDRLNVINCDKTEEIGGNIQSAMDNKIFGNVKMKRNDKVSTLQTLCSSIQLDDEKVGVNPLTLFLRLITIVDRQTEKEISDYFYYELSPYPMSLFKNNMMRVPAKHVLKSLLLKNVTSDENTGKLNNECRVLDGGALLWVCDWKKGEEFSIIFDRYVRKCRELCASVVVFDGYEESTKAQTRERRAKKVSRSVEIHERNKCTTDRTEFFGNYTNKSNFIKVLSRKLEEVKVEVVIARSDADTTIVKEALSLNKKPTVDNVTIVSDDTDVLCLLLHHCSDSEEFDNIYLMGMKKGGKAERQRLRVRDVANGNDKVTQLYILFSHSFSGCDTTSAIFNFGKTRILEKLKVSAEIRSEADKFYLSDVDPEAIGNCSVRLFELMFSNSPSNALPLSKLRRQKYDEMVSGSRKDLDPSALPPSPRAAHYHGLRVYHQIMVWTRLSEKDVDPLRWGWTMVNGFLEPIKTDAPAAPQTLLKVIRCSCKGACNSNRCSCRRNGLKCASACKECNGLTCKNAETEMEEDESIMEDSL